MPLVATLISHPSTAVLSHDLVHRAAEAVDAPNVLWLADSVACDLEIAGLHDASRIEAILRETLAGTPVDVAVQEASSRRKSVLVADMDSTMIDQECIDELAAEIGIGERIAAITARAMNGEIDFEPALRERVGLLSGLTMETVEKVVNERITLASGARTLVSTMRSKGAWTALVSGGFTMFTGRVAAMLGFDEHRANTLVIENDALTGAVAEPILGRAAKAESLREIAAVRGLTEADVMAIGDGANDLDMIAIAGSGVAIHAKPAVAARAPLRIDHGDLTALLYLQGYRADEFVAT